MRRGKKRIKIELTVSDLKWVVRGLFYAASAGRKSRPFAMAMLRLATAIGGQACRDGHQAIKVTDSYATPNTGGESFGCELCGWETDVVYY